MRELIDFRPGMSMDILQLPICLIDLARIPSGQLRGHPAVCSLLDSLQSASAGHLSQRFAGIFSRLQNVLGDSRMKGWATALATYYGAIEGYAEESIDTLRRAFTTLLFDPRETDKMTVTIAEHYRREGAAIGKAEGRAEGKAEGKIESITMFLELRFGRIPAALKKKLQDLRDGERIDETLRLAATCRDLKEFKASL